MSSEIQCGSVDDALNIFKQSVIDGSGQSWIDCENASYSLDAILKQMLFVDDTGNVYLNIR